MEYPTPPCGHGYMVRTPYNPLRTAAYHRFLVRLKQARLEARLTQVQVAKRLGRTQAYVWKCESGERRVDAVEMHAFIRIYHKPFTFFVG